jgi:hypothetical protein
MTPQLGELFSEYKRTAKPSFSERMAELAYPGA